MKKIIKENAFNDLPTKLDLKDVASLLSISPQTIDRLKDDGEICVEDGHIKKEELLRFIERHFIVNVPSFTIEENLVSYIHQRGGIPLWLDQGTLIYILNEIPVQLKKWPGYTGDKIDRNRFIDYLQRHENIDLNAVINTVKQQKTR